VIWNATLTKRSGAVVAAILAGGVFAGAVVAGQLRGNETQERLRTAIDHGALVEVATIPAAAGRAERGVFAQMTSAGFLCLWDAPSAVSKARMGGCNPVDDPLGGHALSASLSFDGGPGAPRVTDARFIGLVAANVAAVRVLLKDGSLRTVTLHQIPRAIGDFRAFGYRLKTSDIRLGGPTALVAYDSNGNEIDRQATGF
jgi:hypothetical protein